MVRKKSRSAAARDFIFPVCSFINWTRASSGVFTGVFLKVMPDAGVCIWRSPASGITADGSSEKLPIPGRSSFLVWYKNCDNSSGNFKTNGF